MGYHLVIEMGSGVELGLKHGLMLTLLTTYSDPLTVPTIAYRRLFHSSTVMWRPMTSATSLSIIRN